VFCPFQANLSSSLPFNHLNASLLPFAVTHVGPPTLRIRAPAGMAEAFSVTSAFPRRIFHDRVMKFEADSCGAGVT
jgi:hypothetical protein